MEKIGYDKRDSEMNSKIYFDIETAPLDESYIVKLAPDFKAPSNYKSDEAIEKYKLGQLAEFIANAALSATTGRVVAIGAAVGESFPEIVMDADAENEASIIEWFWGKIADQRGVIADDVIGHNSNRFDIPFLIRRSWILGVKIPATVLVRSRGRMYLNEHFKDTMDAWACGTMDKIKLDLLAKTFGVGGKNGVGANFYKTLLSDSAAAFRYLSNDVELTRAVAQKMGM